MAGWLAVQLTKCMPAILTMLILSVTPFQWEVSVWWSAAIYAIPYQLFMLLTVAALVRIRGMVSPGAFQWSAAASTCRLPLIVGASRACCWCSSV